MALFVKFMMRVAFVTGGVPLGGSATFTLFLAAALRQLGVLAEVFTFTTVNPLAKEFSEAGVAVHTQDEKRLIYEDRLQNVYAGLRAFKPTAVIAVLGSEAFETLRYLPAGVSRIGVFHDRAIQPRIFGPRYRDAMDHLVVVAAYLRDEMRAFDPQFPCTYLAHGIPIPTGTAPRSPNPKDPLRLLYYGRFENASKGVRLFPEIADALKGRQIPFVWTIHGYGPEEEFLKEALAEEVQQGQVKFSKPVSYQQLPSLIRNHDVYLLASTNEGGPLTLLEAMALGLVPVCGDIPCLVQEVITSENGFRVPRDKPEAYAEAIAALNGNRPLLERLSSAAQRTITDHFSSQAMARRYISFLESLPAGKNAGWPERIRPLPILGQHGFRYGILCRGIRRIVKAWT
jgi:glycosyltransferase involved in cell wall biosynthesis